MVEFLPDGVNVILCSDIRFYDSLGRIWSAFSGKRSDGASIPRLLWFWLGGPYNGFHRDGALLHDDAAYLFAPANEVTFFTALFSSERGAADRMIREATIVRIDQAKLNWFCRDWEVSKADAIYLGLRIGGWLAWMDHAKQNAKGKI